MAQGQVVYQQQQVVTQTVTDDYPKEWPSFPTTVTCRGCNNRVETHTSQENGMMVWVVMLVLCVLGFVLCSPIALCIPSLKDVVHYCPNCKKVLGKKEQLKL